MKDLDDRLHQDPNERMRCMKQLEVRETQSARDSEARCHNRHRDDIRDLKLLLKETQRLLTLEKSRSAALENELKDLRSRFSEKQIEWKAFQDDLLTTVRVANDFKREAQETVEKIALKNRKLQQKISDQEGEIAKLKMCQIELQRLSSTQSTVDAGPLIAVVPPVTPRRSVSVSPVVSTIVAPPPRSPKRSITLGPVVMPEIASCRRDVPQLRNSIAKWVDTRSSCQLSVKSLINSIESASKNQASKSNAMGSSSPPASSAVSPTSESPASRVTFPPPISNSPAKTVSENVIPSVRQSVIDEKQNNKTDRKIIGSELHSTPFRPLPLSNNKFEGLRRNAFRYVSHSLDSSFFSGHRVLKKYAALFTLQFHGSCVGRFTQ